MLAAGTLGLTATALAAEPPPGFAAEEPGKTVVGVQVARAEPGVLSFEVPLYMTVAVVDGAGADAEVVCPTTYSIRNLSTAPDGTAVPIGVTGLAVQSAPGGTWSLKGSPTGPEEIALNIGKIPLPSVAAGAVGPVSADLRREDSMFYDPVADRYREISADAGGTSLPLIGAVAPGTTVAENVGPSAQFRCIYTVSLLDASGKVIDVFYDGPGKDEAIDP